MIILRAGAASKRAKRNRDAFLRLVGECVTRWAFTDRALFMLFQRALSVDRKAAGIIYYRLNTISSKIQLADSAINLVAMPSNLKVWQKYKNTLNHKLIPVRNIIAHHPMLQETSSSPKLRMRFRYFIRVEPYEVEAGQRTPRIIDVKMMRTHATRVDKMTGYLLGLEAKIAADSQGRLKHFRR